MDNKPLFVELKVTNYNQKVTRLYIQPKHIGALQESPVDGSARVYTDYDQYPLNCLESYDNVKNQIDDMDFLN